MIPAHRVDEAGVGCYEVAARLQAADPSASVDDRRIVERAVLAPPESSVRKRAGTDQEVVDQSRLRLVVERNRPVLAAAGARDVADEYARLLEEVAPTLGAQAR